METTVTFWLALTALIVSVLNLFITYSWKHHVEDLQKHLHALEAKYLPRG